MGIASIGVQMSTMDRPPAEEMPAGVQRVQATGLAEQAIDVSAAVEQIQMFADMFNREIRFQASNELKRVIVNEIDISTDKIIREILSQEIQRLQMQTEAMFVHVFDQYI